MNQFRAALSHLGATKRIPVGTSIVSAMTRHPAVLAMEIAGISRAFPGRFWPGIDAIAMFLPHESEQDTLTLSPRRSFRSWRRAASGGIDHVRRRV